MNERPKTTLVDLPTEILLEIIKYVANDGIDTEPPIHHDNGRVVPFNGARNLVLVDKSFHNLATQTLYRKVNVDQWQIIKLIRTLIAESSLGHHIQGITLRWAGIHINPDHYETYHDPLKVGRSTCEDCMCKSGNSLWTLTERDIITNLIIPPDMPQCLKSNREYLRYGINKYHNLGEYLVILLHMVPNLQALDMGCVYATWQLQRYFLDERFTKFLHLVLWPTKSDTVFDKSDVLLGLDIERQYSSNHGENKLSVTHSEIPAKQTWQYLPLGLKNLQSFSHHYQYEASYPALSKNYPFSELLDIYRLPSIHTIAFDRVMGAVADDDTELIVPVSSNVKELNLNHANLKPSELKQMICAFKCLTKFAYRGITPAATALYGGSAPYTAYFEPTATIHTLRQHKNTLEYLCLTYNTLDGIMPFYKPVGTLRDFSKLVYVETTSSLLISGNLVMDEASPEEMEVYWPAHRRKFVWNPIHRLNDLLPATLQEFRFTFMIEHAPQAIHQLRELVEDRNKFPQLGKIIIANTEFDPYENDFSRETAQRWKEEGLIQGQCLSEQVGMLELRQACFAQGVALHCSSWSLSQESCALIHDPSASYKPPPLLVRQTVRVPKKPSSRKIGRIDQPDAILYCCCTKESV